MAITSVGYDGTVTEVQWAQMISAVGSSTYGVAGVNDWKVSVHPTLDKGINIAPGTGYGHGIFDISDATATITGAALASGTRYDMVVAKRDWTGAGGVTTFRIITGSSSRTMPNRQKTPGSIDEQPIALVRFDAGQTKASAIVDLRVWIGPGGAMAVDDMALGYLQDPGARVMIGGVDWTCTVVGGSATWSKAATIGYIPLFGVGSTLIGGTPPAGTMFLMQVGTVVQATDAAGNARITWPKPFPNGLVSLDLGSGDEFANGAGSTVAPTGGTFWGTSGGGNKVDVVYTLRNAAGAVIPARGHRVNYTAIGW